eukprot:TRINITY_DN2101_c0_g1_i1.p1 TRINITY_DN2101_c0_g1~~TRINITY_DN2101_c0_g1_i1.p1  ORF type:complete len:146 (+),score=88.96 TRINITY_DN2101_c0_g1_i1:64-438(+)
MADPTVQVTWEDQQKINQFGILNNRRHELEESHKELKEKHLQLEEASEEMILADDGAPVMYRIGDSFLYLAKDTVEARIERDQAAVAARLAATQGELADTEDTLQGLKKALYGKFGDSINLEER